MKSTSPKSRHKFMALGVAAAALVGTGSFGQSAAADSSHPPNQSHFGFMFRGLPAFTEPTLQQVADLAQTMLDPNDAVNDNPATPSIFTYLGQFIDHDLTLDTLPQPSSPVDPTTLLNNRTFRFDLDSVYGGGPLQSPQLYAPDHKHFLVQEINSNGVRDLPRNLDGSAILAEGRNDENEIISQIHTAFLEFHNKLIDRGAPFLLAQQLTRWYYQWVVLHEVLPHFVGPDVVAGTLNGTIKRFYNPGPNPFLAPMTPVEFSVAAYRFGHSIVRKAYVLNAGSGKVQVFNGSDADLHGGRPLPANRQIDFGNFDPELQTEPAANANVSRKVDTLISSGLFDLPIPGAEASGSNVLAFRNMTRAIFYGMPSGQSVAQAMGVPVIPPDQVTIMPGFDRGSPLWYYILKESENLHGTQLGPVGGRIVADVFIRLLQDDPTSILHVPFVPLPPVAPKVGQFDMADFLVFAGVAARP